MRGELLARLHARIDCRNGRFSLTDQSTNGTWMTDAGGSEHAVRRDSLVLCGTGKISFGRQAAPGQKDLVRYSVATA